LVSAAGLEVRQELADPLPLEVHTFFAASRGDRLRASLKGGVRRGLFAVAPRAAERVFTLHYACLCS
jgi:hypothetical protein